MVPDKVSYGLTLLWDYFPLARDPGQSAHCFVKLLSRNLGFFNIVAEDLAWIQEAKEISGIRSIICLLDEHQLKYYEKLPVDLVSYYRSKGFEVEHIKVPKLRRPPLSDRHLKEVWSA